MSGVSNRLRVFVTRRRVPEAVSLLESRFDVEVWPERTPPPREELLKRLAYCEAIVTEIDDVVDEAALRSAPNLRVVANRAVGLDNVDVGAATRLGVLVSNTPGVLQESCADFAFAMILALARNVPYADRQVREGAWTMFDQSPYLGTDVYGATLGIVGLGGIGEAVMRRAMGFDMRVLYHSRSRRSQAERDYGGEWSPDLDSLLANSDFVSLHVPLTPETDRLIGRRELALMRPTAFLINTARGRVVDTEALCEALTEGSLAGAALDVTDPEPLPPDHPLVGMSNVIVTPHISSGSAATVRRMGMMAAENVVAALTGGEMVSCVNPAAANRG